MLIYRIALSALMVLACGVSQYAVAQTTGKDFPIIPIPQQVQPQSGGFTIQTATKIGLGVQSEPVNWVSAYLNEHLQKRLGAPLLVQKGARKLDNTILLKLQPTLLKPEGYKLTVSAKGILLEGGSEAGLFYGIQSLIQLFPDDSANGLRIPGVYIEDHPAFSYRGMHLDVGRHFFPVSFVKQYIDMLARYKMNRFHWHLTEDQGWRIEIKKYPKLQEISAYRNETLIGHYSDQPQRYDNKRYGGFYTHEEIREIVQYARERFVTIIPEIEMPGHAQAAIAAYPELGCTGSAVQVATTWGVFEDVFCPSEGTFTFLQDVLTEVMELFPSEYIHIGGDECPKTQWKTSPIAQEVMKREGLKDEHELQSYFIRRIETFLNQKGRQIIGWDEILEGGLAPNATVMSWRGIEGGIEAARQKHKVIMTPTSHCYFDYYQAVHPDEPIAIGGYLPLEKVYHYNPIPDALSAEEATYILGAQANLWTEYIQDGDKVEYMVYPRMQALAEGVWSGAAKKNFADFVSRFLVHLPRLEAEGIQVANHFFDIKTQVMSGDGKGVRVGFTNAANQGTIRYTAGTSQPGLNDQAVDGEVQVTQSGTYTAKTFFEGAPVGRSDQVAVQLHLAAGKSISLKNAPAPQYTGSGPGSVINGVRGNDNRYGDAEWLGFSGTDFEAVIDLGEPTSLRKLVFRFFNSPGQWIYPPREIAISVANLPDQFEPERITRLVPTNTVVARTVSNAVLYNTKARFIKVRIPNYGLIPDGQQGAGNQAWLFVDEIIVE